MSQTKFQPKDDGSAEKGKMFIGGLNWETTQDSLFRYFSRYGEITDCVVMHNHETGRSRGFGFVTFADPCCVDLVLQNMPHMLDNKTIEPKPCNPRSASTGKTATRKNAGGNTVFLGGLPSNFTENDLRNFFSKYGKVTEVIIKYDHEKQTCRGFGFLTFESEESVDRCCGEHYVSINGKQVEIKRAEPRDARGSFGGMGGRGGRHGGRWDGPGMGRGGMGPVRPMGPMGRGGMMGGGGYQGGWSGPGHQGGYGYGPHSGYQNWGPQGGQWGPPGANYGYGGPQGGPQGAPQGGYNSNWGDGYWGGPQGPPGPQGGPAGPTGDVGYGRGAGPVNGAGPVAGPGGPAPGNAVAPGPKNDMAQYSGGYGTNGYGTGGGYAGDGNQGFRSGYGQGGGPQTYGGGPSYGNPDGVPPAMGNGIGGPAVGGPGAGPGPVRGGYSQPPQSQYHPYRR